MREASLTTCFPTYSPRMDMDVLTTGTGQQRNIISFQFIIIDRPVFSVVFPVFCAQSLV